MPVKCLSMVVLCVTFGACGVSSGGLPEGDAASSDAQGATTEDTAAPAPDAPAPLEDTSTPPTVYGGRCDAPFPEVSSDSWTHGLSTPLVTALGGPNHRIRDLILKPGEAGKLRGRFTYGEIDKDLEEEDVELFVQTCPGWQSLGTLATDSKGVVFFDVAGDLPPGDYRVRMVVKGDLSTADGVVAVWPAGMKIVVTDVDGTLTTSDWELFADVIFGQGAQMYDGANDVIAAWAGKGYRVVYLTGRPQIVNRYTRGWLDAHGFPLGPLLLTEDPSQVLPTEAGVGTFKKEVLTGLQASPGVDIVAAYGNATTDIYAYAGAGIPKDVTFIIGTHAGKEGTQAVSNYPSHLPWAHARPEAVQP